MNRVLGVLGGMGALASAAFLTTIYRRNPAVHEQNQPKVLLRSNPQIPDRTALLLGGKKGVLTAVVAAELTALLAAGADRLVICCMTAHAVWFDLPAPVRAAGLSLVDALYSDPRLAERPRLVLCTQATRALGLIQAHPRFPSLADRLVFPDPAGQAVVHDLVYRLKRGAHPKSVIPSLTELARSAGTQGVVAACTEFHLLFDLLPDAGLDVVDPLAHIADQLSELLA